MAGKITLKITLKDITPAIWRRIEVPSTFTFNDLYLCIQAAMGWKNYHLSDFNANGKTITRRDFEPEGEFLDSEKTKLLPMLKKGGKFEYHYDFGDDWYHEVKVESIEPSASISKPTCTGGERACPPEDCGGVYGYANLLKALSNPSHEQHKELKNWAGRFDPEKFDLEKVQKRILNYTKMEER